MTHRRTGVLLAAALLAAATGCSTKAADTGTATSGSGVKTGPGISGTTIGLGLLTDLTGVFAAQGKDMTNAQKLYWDGANAAGGVCGKYQVSLNVKDHGYVTQQGVSLYSAMKNDVLALQQTIGSPINTALAPQLEADKMVNFPAAWAASLTENPENAVVGATYEIEMINALDYLLEQGKIAPGDTIGHIYFEGEYGAGGLQGSKYFAGKHGMRVVESRIKSTDSDMTAQVTQLKAEGVKAIALTVAPGQTASAAGVAAAQGLDVPIVGNNPVYAPGLLKGPAAAALKKNLYVASPVSSFDKQPKLLADFTAAYPGDPSLSVVYATAAADTLKKILEKACADGDLTREGVSKAKAALGSVDNGLSVPVDFSRPGVSPSLKSFIITPADVPGGAKAVADLYQGPDSAGFTPSA